MEPFRIAYLQDHGLNESLALAELAGTLAREGHGQRLFLEREEPRLESELAGWAPRLVVIPANVYAASTVLRLARRAHRALPGVPVLVGGTHPTFASDFIGRHPEIDLQLVGEADIAIPQLVRRLAAGHTPEGVPGIWHRVGGAVVATGPAPRPADLDQLGIPERTLYYRYPFMRDFPWKKFSSGRGCENDCAFCYNHHVSRLYGGGRFVRRKSPARVVAEVQAVRSVSRLEWVHFADDLFVTDPDWLAGFGELWRQEVRLPFSCNSSADRMTPAVARLLAQAGGRVVAVGMETADEQRRVRMLAKPTTDALLRTAAAAIRGQGMELVLFAMVALPGECLEEAIATLRMAAALGADGCRILMAVPLPGTRLTSEAARAGQLAPEIAADSDRGIDFGTNPRGPFFPVHQPAAFENLVNLAPLWRRLPPSVLSALLPRIPAALTRPGRLWMSLQERRLYRFSLLDGLRFYLHVGNPMGRTTNYVTLI